MTTVSQMRQLTALPAATRSGNLGERRRGGTETAWLGDCEFGEPETRRRAVMIRATAHPWPATRNTNFGSEPQWWFARAANDMESRAEAIAGAKQGCAISEEDQDWKPSAADVFCAAAVDPHP